jgi:Animal haem peroxidase
MKKKLVYLIVFAALVLLIAYPFLEDTELAGCLAYFSGGVRGVATDRSNRFLGKVHQDTIRCRGRKDAAPWRATPWLDWQRYWGAGDASSKYAGLLSGLGFLSPNHRGIAGALLDLEYQRIELLKFNLFDNSGTFEEYVRKGQSDGKLQRIWPQFRLPKNHPSYARIGGDGAQKCSGELIRFRTLDGICNDIMNPLMGATGRPFARNVDFYNTFPELSTKDFVKNRHGHRIGSVNPDPQVISRRLFTRTQSVPEHCNAGQGLAGNSTVAHCDYQKAPHLNVLAAFWIQFMTHDWFSHLDEGQNRPELMAMGCQNTRVNGLDQPLSPDDIARLGCRPGDRIDRAIMTEDDAPKSFKHGDKEYLFRAHKTTPNKVTAWWDASQIYGYDDRSRRRVKRDPRDRAKLLLEIVEERPQERIGYLPVLRPPDPMNPQWAGQEGVAFPDNWNIGLSFFHNLFAREHNLFVDNFRDTAMRTPDEDSGLRNPARLDRTIRYSDVSDDELFEVARLVIAAEIAKIHTIEWTTQLLYNEPLYLAMNANWSGLLKKHPLVSAALEQVVQRFANSENFRQSTGWFSAFAAGPGIFGLANQEPDFNAGVHHFGSPFNFPEEFINAYRLHSMVPDLIEYRDLMSDSNAIKLKIPVMNTLGGDATRAMRRNGMANWALSLGRQRMGKLTLQNHPLFLQNLQMPRLKSATGKIDVLALDIIRDRERGMPRYNEFRRQYGLKQLTRFDDFIDPRLAQDSIPRKEQEQIVKLLREIYGQHRCEAGKDITKAQKNENGSTINDCLGRPNGSVVDNIEDVDALVGWLAEFVRPHGFAISETQLQVFILNASRRLFSDRFLTSGFRPEFYSHLGVSWVNNNGPDGKIMEKGKPNGHEMEVSPLKRVLLRTVPALRAELEPVVNVFDPWARDRGEYYSLQWKPRPGAESDDAFKK